MKFRFAALIMAALMLLAVLVGCSDPNGGDKTTTPGGDTPATTPAPGDSSQDTTSEPAPEFVDANYNDADFVVFQRNANASSYGGYYITSDSVTDTMSEATFTRNVAVEDKYRVKIKALEVSDPYKEIRTYITSGDIPFDVILDRRTYMGSLAQEGYLYNFRNLEHIDMTRSYWDSNCAESYDVAGKLFFMANDISVSNLAGARFFYFNKQLLGEYDLENPYDLVEKNQWTLEKFLTMVNSVSTDNGDGIWDGNDVYGLCSETGSSNGNIMHLLVGCGINFIDKTADGLTTNAYTEKTQNIMTSVAAALIGNQSVLSYEDAAAGADMTGFANKFDYGRSLFANDHFLFIQGNMGVSSQLKDMKSDYGVAPNPKYDSAQQSYFHKMDRFSLIWAIPKCEMDYDRVGIIMEYWAYESSQTVMPAYYEITIKTKRVQEETASQMIDLIKDSIRYDLSELYNSDILSVLYTGYENGNLSSTWASSKKLMGKSFDKVYKAISELED